MNLESQENAIKTIEKYTIKNYEELYRIEEDIRPREFNYERRDPGTLLNRVVTDVAGLFIGYIGFFLIANLIRSTITKQPLYNMYWMYFGPYYYLTGAPFLTQSWETQSRLLEHAEGNECIQYTEEGYQSCTANGGSIFHCEKQKLKTRLGCIIYDKCSHQTIEELIDFYIHKVPADKHVNTSHLVTGSLLAIVSFPLFAAEKLQSYFTGYDPINYVDQYYKDRTEADHNILTPIEIEILQSEETYLYLKNICLQKQGDYDLRVKGLTYQDVANYFYMYVAPLAAMQGGYGNSN